MWAIRLVARALLRKKRVSEISVTAAHGFGEVRGDQEAILSLHALLNRRPIFGEYRLRGAADCRRIIW